MQQIMSPVHGEPLKFRCIEDNIGFVMLGEVLRARSHELLEQLKSEKPDLGHLRRLALNMQLSTDNLVQEAGLVAPDHSLQQLYNESNSEPASVQSIIDLCSVAAKHRLNLMNLSLHGPHTVSQELFVSGNAWELSYALLFILIHSAQALNARAVSELNAHKVGQQNTPRTIQMQVEYENDFVDIVISSHSRLSPHLELNPNDLSAPLVLNHSEWFCLQKLVTKNNAHLHVQKSTRAPFGPYNIVFRLATFQPGHEEPLDFITMNEPQNPQDVQS